MYNLNKNTENDYINYNEKTGDIKNAGSSCLPNPRPITIMTAPSVNLSKLENLFIELTNQNCNLRCKHCYINFDPYKKIKDYIPIDVVKDALKTLNKNETKMITLTGGEPLLHPDFNLILRSCLKLLSTTIFTNGMNINEKKARFLKKVEDETDNELFFNISLDCYDERKNDDIRGRGSFRKAIGAIQSLSKYEFKPTIKYTNYYKEDESTIIEGLKKAFKRYFMDSTSYKLAIKPFFDKHARMEFPQIDEKKLQTLPCATSRVLSAKGIYNCPMLANDYRARTGSNLNAFASKIYLESEFCTQCVSEIMKK